MPLPTRTRRRVARAAVLACTVLAGVAGSALVTASAQLPVWRDSLRDDSAFDFYAGGAYRPAVPRPDSLLGYAVGRRNTQYADQQRVLQAIASAASDRVRVEDIGFTAEGRPMRVYVASAPENIARLDAIRADLARLADPRLTSQAEAAAIADRIPAVVMLSFSVHGNESPGFEAAMTILHQLASGTDAETVAALQNTIVVINPSSNPDGHERFAVWYTSMAVGNPDPSAMEHREPWSVQGRFNHYRFDMNRDVIASTQPEVQAILRAMLRWKPQVAVDLHGQTEQYFFPPAAQPVNANIGPESAKWLDVIGRGNATAFDENGWLYYVRDVFDLYYPGYWDTWPSLTGATGMTYETDGGGWKGLLWRREDGSLLSFRDGIAKHHVAGLATVSTIAARKAERLRDYAAFRRRAVAEGRTARMKRVVWSADEDPARAAALAAALLRSGIEVRRAERDFGSARAHAYSGERVQGRRFPAGSYVVDLAQPQGRVARAILEPSPTVESAFAAEQLARFRRNQQRGPGAPRDGYEFYDVTAWALPVAFGLEAWWTEDAPGVDGELLTLPPVPTGAALAAYAAEGSEALPVDVGGGVVGGARASTAYLFTPERDGSARLAYRLLAEGFRVAVATRPVEADGYVYGRGTYVVRVTRNDSSLHSRIDALAREAAVDVRVANTAYTTEAQFGIGSEPVVSLRLPRVAIIGDEGISQTAYGALWWAFERRFGIPFRPLSLDALRSVDLSELDVIIMPSGSAGTIASRLGRGATDALKGWIERGGTLVTTGGSTAWAVSADAGLTTVRRVGADRDSAAAGDSVPRVAVDSLLAVVSPGAVDNPVPVPGAHMDVVLDRTHWLTHGYERPRVTVLVEGSTFLTLSRTGTNVGVFPQTGPLHRGGFLWPNNTERLLRNTAFLIEEPLGDGHLVLFQNEPTFRGWWRALDRMLLNAVLLGPVM